MNSRKIFAGAVAIVLGATSIAAQADHGRYARERGHDRDGYRDQDYARVLQVEPLLERVRYSEPVEQCWTEDRYRDDGRAGYRPDRTGAAIVGGAVGAILGSTIGHGDGRRAATLGGAFLGAALGSEAARNDQRGYREPRVESVQRCRTSYQDRYDERVVAYRVTYVYNGRREVTRLAYDPGRYLRVAVDVRPLG
jgi:uncharacterized protein YcfJ